MSKNLICKVATHSLRKAMICPRELCRCLGLMTPERDTRRPLFEHGGGVLLDILPDLTMRCSLFSAVGFCWVVEFCFEVVSLGRGEMVNIRVVVCSLVDTQVETTELHLVDEY